jgi:hypothetical protein
MNNEGFDFKKFLGDSQNTLLKPKEYFAGMPVTGGLTEPLIKALLYGAAAGILYFIWGLLNLGTVGLFGGAVGFLALIWTIIGSVVGLFIGAVIVLVLSAIAKGSTDFETCVRVSASIMVLLPVIAFLSIISGLSLKLSLIISLLVNLYGLFLLYNALIGSLKANQKTSQIVVIVLAAIMALFMLAGLGARRGAERYMKNLDRETKDMLKDFGIN